MQKALARFLIVFLMASVIPGFFLYPQTAYASPPSGSPPTVTTSAATSIGDTTATGNGNVTSDGGATVTERGIVWSTSANPTTADSKATAAGTTGAFSASITGLSPSTLYHVRAYATNSVGTSYGADVTFTTSAGFAGGFSDWSNRVAITIQHGKVAADQTDFPVYVNLSDLPAGFWSAVNSDCGDIRVTESDGVTEVPREVVTCSTSGHTGELHFQAPSLSSSSDTTFYIYYGNSGASDYATSATYGAQNVWDSNYAGVWHLKDGTTLSATDSTSNGNNGTIGTPSATTGELDGAGSFNGTSDRITLARTSSLSATTAWTLEAWVYPTSAPQGTGVIAEAYNGTDGSVSDMDVQYELGYGMNEAPGGSSALKVGFYDGTWRLAADSVNVTLNQWYQIAGSWNGTTLTLYRNGSQVTSSTPGGTVPTGLGNFFIGERHDHAGSVNYFPGKIDEVRISKSTRSLSWLSTEYNNQSNTATFYSVGSQEAPGGSVPARILRLKGGIRLKGHIRLE